MSQSADNLGSRVAVPYLPALNPAGAFSVELWAKPALAGTGPYLYFPLLASSRDLGGGWFVSQYPSSGGGHNAFTFWCSSGSLNYVNASATLAIDTGKWYHVVGVFDGVNVTLYIDGTLAVTTPIPAGQSYQPNNSLPLAFGSDNLDGWLYQGDLDEAALYTYALTAAQVQAHYQAGTNPSPLDLEEA